MMHLLSFQRFIDQVLAGQQWVSLCLIALDESFLFHEFL